MRYITQTSSTHGVDRTLRMYKCKTGRYVYVGIGTDDENAQAIATVRVTAHEARKCAQAITSLADAVEHGKELIVSPKDADENDSARVTESRNGKVPHISDDDYALLMHDAQATIMLSYHRQCGMFVAHHLANGPRTETELKELAEKEGVDFSFAFAYTEKLTRDNGETVYALDTDGMTILRKMEAGELFT